ncbi:PHP domain-containing protein [Clostridium lundense]|uniref:PHP domain-containing protein n=1 Tax=Clostridium lundense TaxID=319475 RepID=UPI00047F68B2|nr:PHP domain-containing protein [Clostridium lundense]
MYFVDLHTHTKFSDGQPDYKEVINRAKEIGLKCVAITDHFDPYDPKDEVRNISEKDLIEFLKNAKSYGYSISQPVLCGIETCTDFNGNIRVSDKVFNTCDLIITSGHYVEYEGEIKKGEYFNDFYWESYKEKIINMGSGQGDIIGHPEGYLPIESMIIPNTTTYEQRKEICKLISERYFDENFINQLTKALIKNDKAYELHCATETPRISIIQSLMKKNVRLSVGTDAHVLQMVGRVNWALDILKKNNYKNLFDYLKLI